MKKRLLFSALFITHFFPAAAQRPEKVKTLTALLDKYNGNAEN